MRRAFILGLACAALTAAAQDRPMPSLPGFSAGMMIDRRQLKGMQMQMPWPEEQKEIERQSAEISRLSDEMQRLQRLGRLDEAEALARKLDELMNSGPLGARMQQQRERTRDVLRQFAPALGIDVPEEAL